MKVPFWFGFSISLFVCNSLWAHVNQDHVSPPPATLSQMAAKIIPLDQVKVYKNNGNSLQGLATRSQGATEHEVWRTSILPGAETPLHTHSSEETFVVLKGEGFAVVDGEKRPFKAPCTIIAPAGLSHKIINTGTEATEAIVVVGIGSEIKNAKNEAMNLPWRK